MSSSFLPLRTEFIADIDCEVTLYEHSTTQAKVLHLKNDDPNRLFCIQFPTYLSSSNGVAHILEHSVLTGSEKFPLKDPFAELTRSTQTTFLNAMTGEDRTTYPFSTFHPKEYAKLMEVYLDLVFRPKLSREAFETQGWHYEISAEGRLQVKGVVLNEMKGYYASPWWRSGIAFRKALFPHSPFSHCNGGDPAQIITLTYEEFLQFYRKYYHPSNSYTVLYGAVNASEALGLLEEYFGAYKKNTVEVPLDTSPSLSGTQRKTARIPAQGKEKEEWVTLGWSLGKLPLAPQDRLAQRIWNATLLGRSEAPLKKKLRESGLGAQVIGAGFQKHGYHHYFSVGLAKVTEGQAEKVEPYILASLQEIVDEGVPRKLLQSSLIQAEKALRERYNGTASRGFTLLPELVGWQYGEDPFEALRFEKTLEALKENIENTARALETRINKALVENPSRVTLTLEAHPELVAEEAGKEQELLQTKDAELQQPEKDTIKIRDEELITLQAKPEESSAKATIKVLKREDLLKEPTEPPHEEEDRKGVTISHHAIEAGGLGYSRILYDISDFPLSDFPYLLVVSGLLGVLATEKRSALEIQEEIGVETGGISTYLRVLSGAPGVQPRLYFVVQGTALPGKQQTLSSLTREVLQESNFSNRERILQFLRERRQAAEASVSSEARHYVECRLDDLLLPQGRWNEALSGITVLRGWKVLEAQAHSEWEKFLSCVQSARSRVLQRVPTVHWTSARKEEWREFHFDGLVGDEKGQEQSASVFQPSRTHELWHLDSNVNYSGYAGVSPDIKSASWWVTNTIISREYLWNEIRLKGGAYGGTFSTNINQGMYQFLSWQDPQLSKTLEVFQKAGQELLRRLPSEDDIHRAIIKTLGGIDAPLHPRDEGYVWFERKLGGFTKELRKVRRGELLSTTKKEVHDHATLLQELLSQGVWITLGKNSRFEEVRTVLGTQIREEVIIE